MAAMGMMALCGCIQHPVTEGGARANELEKELKQERDLRSQDRKTIDELRAERAQLTTKLETAQAQIEGSKGGLPGAFRFVATKISLGWLTSSVNWDDKGGDDGMQAFVEVEDQTGDSIKQAGAFRLELYDVGGGKGTAIETWTFTPEAAAKCWYTTPSGYMFKLPYANGTPKAKEVVLVVKAELSEGGKFEVMRTLRVHH